MNFARSKTAGLASIAVLLALTAPAQVSARKGVDGPPVCASQAKVPVKATPEGTKPPGQPRPSVAMARATAERAAADPGVLVAAEPMENFGVARYRVADYADCVGDGGCYWKDLDAQLVRAEAALRTVLAAHARGERLAVVLDIDETTLSSYCEMKREDYGYINRMFNDWVVTPEAAVGIAGTLRLFQEARAAGVAVFFLTGRPEEQRAATERNLRSAGFDGWAGVVLRDEGEREMETAKYKAGERAKMVARGYRLVMSVGDQWSDLTGEPKAEVSVKLPNPFYYLP